MVAARLARISVVRSANHHFEYALASGNLARLVAESLPRFFASPSETSTQVADGCYRTDNEDPQADQPPRRCWLPRLDLR